jgi:hypothetical protein
MATEGRVAERGRNCRRRAVCTNAVEPITVLVEVADRRPLTMTMTMTGTSCHRIVVTLIILRLG